MACSNFGANDEQPNYKNPPLQALNSFGNAFFLHLDPYPAMMPPLPSSDKVISLWQRNPAPAPFVINYSPSERQPNLEENIYIQRTVLDEPVDFLEYYNRQN